MDTVFSHIVQKRFSKVNEDVATDALAFVLHSSESARNGMMKLLRGIVQGLPALQFRTQQTEGTIRPDMWGFAGVDPRVFVENKFWAGLTDNQPVNYLKQLAKYIQPTVLLVVAPRDRVNTLWRELRRRLADARISTSDRDSAAGIVHSVTTESGPVLAITSWTRLLSVLELEAADDQNARSDLIQLRALCDAADSQTFVPISSEELTDQRIPTFVLQLSEIIQTSVDVAVNKNEGVLSITKLMPQASWDRIGRYIRFSHDDGVGAWLGIRFDLWREHGGSPLWLVFTPGEFSHAHEVAPMLGPWTARKGLFLVDEDQLVAIALELPAGEEKDEVVRSVVDRLREIAEILSELPPKPSSAEGGSDSGIPNGTDGFRE